MSQEEEKLIEELKKQIRSYFWGFDDDQTSKFSEKIIGLVYPFISKAYHSGKLVGRKEKEEEVLEMFKYLCNQLDQTKK